MNRNTGRHLMAVAFTILLACFSPRMRGQACQVQLLVGYTSAAASDAGGAEALVNQVKKAVNEMNITFINSRVNQQVQLVRTFEVPFQEAYCFQTDLDSFATNPQVTACMNAYHADYAALILSNDEMCGSYLSWDTVATLGTAYCAVSYPCMTQNLSLPHMLAHLYGCGHLQGEHDSPYPYGHGYNWYWSECASFVTIMGIDDGTNCGAMAQPLMNNCGLIPFFSNPDVAYQGVPTGDARTANNARVLNENSLTMAGLRLFQPQYTISDSVTGYDYGLEIALDTLHTGSFYIAKDHARVSFEAGSRVVLNPGTLLDEGSTFVAETKSLPGNCGN